MKFNSLKSILTFNFIAVAVIPIAVVGFLTLEIISRNMKEEIGSRNYIIAKSLSAEIQRFIQEPITLLSQFNEIIKNKKLIQGEKINEYLSTIIKNYLIANKLNIHYWVPTLIPPQTANPSTMLAYPMISGIIIEYLDLISISSITDKAEIGSSGYVVVVDKNGNVIAHRNRSFVFQHMNIRNFNIVKQGLKGNEGAFQFAAWGKDMLGSVSIVKQTGWLVIVFQPFDEAFLPVRKIKNILLIGVFSALILAIVIAFLTHKTALKPFSDLTSDTRRLASGDYQFLKKHRSYLEVDELTNNFKTMIEAIKSREKALRRSEEKYRLILETMQEGYFEVDIDGNLGFVNDSICRLLGYSKGELLNSNYKNYADERNIEVIFNKFKSIYKSGKAVEAFIWELIKKDGTRCSIETSISLIISDSGKPIGFRGVAKDISERIKVEKEKKKLDEQMHHVLKMDAIGTLAGGIAHDFNNLLMGMQGNVSIMLLNIEKNHPYYQKLRNIEKYIQIGAGLTTKLLGFASGGKYETKPINLNEIIIKQNYIFSRTCKEIKITVKLDKGLWAAEVDSGQINQVLLILYENARQAMPLGGNLHIETQNAIIKENTILKRKLNPGSYIKILVYDSGIGIDEKTQKRIFDPFFSTKQKGKGRGTGLGLASAYGIVKNHGGAIDVSSRAGEGTTFKIFLPATKKQIEKL